MAMLSERMKEIFLKQGIFVLGTADLSGIPNVVPVGRGPTPALMAPVPWDRFRFHDFVPVLRNGAPVSAN